MTHSKRRRPQGSSPSRRTPKAPEKAVPPPDNPQLRHEAGDCEPDSRTMAEKRLAALKRTRTMPTSDEEP